MISRARLGLILVTGLAAVAAATGFLHPLALAITAGGSLAVVAATYAPERLRLTWELVRASLVPAGGRPEARAEALAEAFRRLARVYRLGGAPALERAASREPDEVVRWAVDRALAAADVDDLRDSFEAGAKLRAEQGDAAHEVLLALARLLPAFGLIGTLVGLAVTLRDLGSGDVAGVTAGLAITVFTTLYGAVLANVVVLPIAANLEDHLARTERVEALAARGALLLLREEMPSRVERSLRRAAGLPEVDEEPSEAARADALAEAAA